MKRNRLYRGIAYFILAANFSFLVAQEGDMSQLIYIEQLIESLSEQYGEDADIAIIVEEIEYFIEHPLNLNAASTEKLHQLQFLNDFQIGILQEYLDQKGPILSVYELLYLPGFSKKEVDLLQKFTYCGKREDRSIPARQITRYLDHQILIRSQRILESQKGYTEIADSILQENPDKSRYLGRSEKYYMRYTMNSMDVVQAGVVMEKDAGEEFFTGSNRQGFDFYSAYLRFQMKKTMLKELIVGDYHVRAGQGLLAWSSYAFGKSGSLSSLSRSGELFKVNRSVDENHFFRGVALTLGKEKLSLSCYFSKNSIDASLPDSSVAVNAFNSFNTSGYHNTPSQLQLENSLNEEVYGMNLRYSSNRFRVGLNGLYHQFDKSCLEHKYLYQSNYFKGNEYTGSSIDYRYLAEKFQLFGETSLSYRGWASLNGALFYFNPKLTLGLVHRHYSEKYYSYWADALRENSQLSNEEGLYLGAEAEFGKQKLKIYTDVFSFPWLRYRVNSPSQGYEIVSEWQTNLGETDLIIRYKREQKPINSELTKNLYKISDQLKEQYKIRSILPLSKSIQLQNRLELSRARLKNDSAYWGIFICQDLKIKTQQFPLEFTGRIAWFHAEDYDTRIYVYERDMLYSGGTQMHYGKGWRLMGMVKWKISERMNLWVKLSQSRYPEEEEIGSGLNTIEGNHRTEGKVQLKFDF